MAELRNSVSTVLGEKVALDQQLVSLTRELAQTKNELDQKQVMWKEYRGAMMAAAQADRQSQHEARASFAALQAAARVRAQSLQYDLSS